MDSGFFNLQRNERSGKKALLGVIAALAVVGVVATVAVVSSRPSVSPVIAQMYELEEANFKAFMKTHEKKYESDEEYLKRFNIYKQNVAYINAVNSQDRTYRLAVNKFADLTPQEFKALYLTELTPKTTRNEVWLDEVEASQIDWTNKGVVTPVKDQGQCGSCWSFSTTGALEGLHALNTGSLVSFSEQQLVDCSGSYGNQGCNGGLMDDAFQYVSNNGITTEQSYPYTARDGSCEVSEGANFTFFEKGINYVDVPQGSDSQLLAALEKQPVSIAVDAESWQFYYDGIFSDCGDSLDHGVLLVGANEGEYWKVKNSWGEGWGENGFIRLQYGNTCGLENAASYPTGSS